jgi:GMP synthase (glutamine-hydrolysing)
MILILDFGSQYTQLIARRIREHNVYCEIAPFNVDFYSLNHNDIDGIILSGGPSSVYEKNSPKCSPLFFEMDVPILGICYGMQLISYHFGGMVSHSKHREYGFAKLNIIKKDLLFTGLEKTQDVWMSHGDKITKVPKGFISLAKTNNSPHAIIKSNTKLIYGVQFHPEVVHTKNGSKLIKNFITEICGIEQNWTMKSFVKTQIEEIRNKVGNDKVIAGLSGGVDSSVMAVLIHKAIGKNLTCIFVDNGLLRFNERKKIETFFTTRMHLNVKFVDSSKSFLNKLKGITDPERKRKIIGYEFIEVFDKSAHKIKNVKFLAQGTLYPDVIESVSVKGPSNTIKSHHNVGGLPAKMKLKLIEPLKFLFKDEVRELGKELGLPPEIINRQPFPGPGLAVRILGDITEDRIRILQEADDIIVKEIKEAGLYTKIWQSFGVLLPVKTVGVMGDKRTYENVIALRAVLSNDGMTADWAKLPYELLGKISNEIINKVSGVNRVVYDISSKPPATIEWE